MGLMGTTTNLEVRVDGKVDDYDRAILRAQKATQSYERSLESLERDLIALERQLDNDMAAQLQKQHDAMTKTGRGAVIAGGLMVAGAGLAAKAAMDWESAWTGVVKTVGGSAESLDLLEGQLRDLAKTMPVSHEEIAGVAEAAGQLGVRKEDIADFTKVMVEMGTATNLSAEDAANGMARFMNIMETAPEDVERLGSTIVGLGNNGASTEAEILEMSLRLAGAGRQANMTEADVLSVANAMSSLGIRAEAGGSAVSTIWSRLQKDVELGSGQMLAAAAEVTGMSQEMFSAKWAEDSAGTFNLLIEGLRRVKDQGGSVLQVLGAMGITEIRQRDAMLRLVGAGDLLSESLDQGAKSWENNNALMREAERRFGTTESKVQIAKNQLNDAAITIGESLLPVVASLASFIGNMATAFDDLPGPIKKVVGPAMLVVGALTLLGGAALIAVPKIAAFNAAVNGLQAGALKTAGTRLQATAGVLAGPWGLALTAGIGLLAYFGAQQAKTQQAIQEVTDTLDDQTGAVTENTRQWAAKKLYDSGALKAANDLGLSIQDLTSTVLGDTEAAKRFVTSLNEVEESGKASGDQMYKLISAVGQVGGEVEKGKQAWELQSKAVGESSDAQAANATSAEQAASKQGDLGQEATDAAEAMVEQKTAAEELTEALNVLNAAILGARGGARDYQQTLDDSAKTLREGKRTLDIHTKAGRENQAALDAIAQSTLQWADNLKDVDETGKRSYEVIRQGRKDLYEQARAFGMSEEAAHRLVNQILKLPKDAKTVYDSPGLDKATEGAKKHKEAVERIPKTWKTAVEAETGGARAAINGFVTDANQALQGIHDQDVFINVRNRRTGGGGFGPQGGNWAGGPIIGPGGPRDDNLLVPMSNGEHVWTAREVQAAGGHEAVEALRREVLSGRGAALSREIGGDGRVPGGSGSHTAFVGSSLAGMRIAGSLDIPGIGPAYIRGIVLDELDQESDYAGSLAGRRR